MATSKNVVKKQLDDQTNSHRNGANSVPANSSGVLAAAAGAPSNPKGNKSNDELQKLLEETRDDLYLSSDIAHDAVLRTLRAEFEKAKKDIAEKNAALEKANAINNELNDNVNKLSRNLDETRSLIVDNQKSKAGAEGDTHKLTTELEQTNRQLLALKQERDQLLSKLGQLEKTIAAAQRAQQDYNDYKQQLESQLTAKNAALNAVKEEHENAKKAIEKAKGELRELEAAKDLAHSNLERTKDAQIAALKNDHNIAITKQAEEHIKQKEKELRSVAALHAAETQKQADIFTARETTLTKKIDELTLELTRTKRLAERQSQEIETLKLKIRETLDKVSALESQQQKDKAALAEARNLAGKAVREHSDTTLSLTKANSEKEILNKKLNELRLEHQKQLRSLVEGMINQPTGMGAPAGGPSFTPNYNASRRPSGSASPALGASVASLTSLGSQHDDDNFDDASTSPTPPTAQAPASMPAPAAGSGSMGNK